MDGVEDCSSVGGYGFISYGEIKEFRLVHHPNTKTIAIILKNRKEFISKLAPPKKPCKNELIYEATSYSDSCRAGERYGS